jgi:ribosomal protein S18 acetylase RimI-like enzyme
MNKFSDISNNNIEIGVSPLNTELVYLSENKEQVGSLLLVYEDNKASVFSLEVLVSHRKRGYGRKLMEKAIDRCRERGYHLVELNTETDNPVNKLYKSMGFELKGLKSGFNNYTKSI